MPRYQMNGAFLRAALLANAAFSVLCATLLVAESGPVAARLFIGDSAVFGLPAEATVFGLGLALALFAALVAFTASRKLISKQIVRTVIIADALWAAASIGLLFLSADTFTATGLWTIAAVALAVLSFAVAQFTGLAILYQGESEISISRHGRARHVRVSRAVSASAAAAWDIMIDHESYADVADNLSRVEILAGDAKGMRRKCTGKQGESWTEAAHIWDHGQRYGFTIDTEAPDYPYPLEKLSAVWAVEETGPSACIVSIAFDVTPLSSLKGEIFISISMVMFPKLLHRLLEKWKIRMEAPPSAGVRRPPKRSHS